MASVTLAARIIVVYVDIVKRVRIKEVGSHDVLVVMVAYSKIGIQETK